MGHWSNKEAPPTLHLGVRQQQAMFDYAIGYKGKDSPGRKKSVRDPLVAKGFVEPTRNRLTPLGRTLLKYVFEQLRRHKMFSSEKVINELRKLVAA